MSESFFELRRSENMIENTQKTVKESYVKLQYSFC
jgi:hypothetical protein